MTHTISKEELRRPDHMTEVGQRFFVQLVGQRKLVFGVLGLLILIGVGIVAWDKTTTNRELSVQEQYYVAEKAFLKKKEAFDRAEAEAKDPAKKADAAKATPTGDFHKDYEQEVRGLVQLVDSHSNSKAAAMAALELSQIYTKYEMPKEAMQILAKVKGQQSSDDLLGAMVLHSYATLLANQGQCQESVGIWESLEAKKRVSFVSEQAQLGRALCLENLGQVEKAESVLQAIVTNKPTSGKQSQQKPKTQIQQTAENYLRYLKFKKNLNPSKAS
ncbi:MAG: hypothetical protein RJB66_961 [Pseudomonadota bacterium]|jgi:predicted negative regulator of RcsB-dependent stress response